MTILHGGIATFLKAPVVEPERSALEAGAGVTVSIGEARLTIRLGTSSPGSSGARGILRRPGSASRSRRSSGVQMIVGSSMRRSVAWIGQASR
jgi:hypothetical protein